MCVYVSLLMCVNHSSLPPHFRATSLKEENFTCEIMMGWSRGKGTLWILNLDFSEDKLPTAMVFSRFGESLYEITSHCVSVIAVCLYFNGARIKVFLCRTKAWHRIRFFSGSGTPVLGAVDGHICIKLVALKDALNCPLIL